MLLREAVLRFLEYCELDKNLSKKTVRMYGYYMEFFQDWIVESQKSEQSDEGLKKSISDTFTVEEITDEMVRQFRLYLSRDYKNPFKGDLKQQT